MATLQDTIDSMKEKNFQQFASQQEKRTREILQAVDQYQKKVSGENQAYMNAIRDAVEKSASLSAGQLKNGVNSLKDIENVIKAQKDMAAADRQVLLQASDIARMQMEAKSQSGILSKIKETISNNAIDITSVAAGLSGNSPAVMFATKYVLDKRKQMKEEKQAAKKAQAEESLARLESIAAAKQENKNAKEEAKILGQKSSGGGAAAAVGDSSAELVVWNELQAEYLQDIKNGIDAFLRNEIISSRNDEENRREGNRQTEKLIDAVEGIEVGDGGAKKAVEETGGILSSLMGMLGPAGLGGAIGGLTGGLLGTGAGGLMGVIGRLASAAAPIASVAVGAGMIAKDVYDMAAAALDNDITTEIEGQDMGGVIGGALLGTVGAFVGGPLGAGLGMALGNMVGSFVGDVVAPNYQEVLNESQTKIQASKEGLAASLSTIQELYESGQISQAEYEQQRAVIESQQALNAQHEAQAAEVERLNQTRLEKGRQYNELNATIQSMEDAGIEVTASMYATLEQLEGEYYAANDAFETAAADLQAQVDPNWYQSLSQTMMATWDTLRSAGAAAFETMSNAFESARGWFAEKIVALDEAFGISDTVMNAVDYVEGKAAELAGAVSETIATTAAAVDEALTENLAKLNLDDEYEALKEGTAAVVDGAREAISSARDAAVAMGEELTQGVNLEDGLGMDDVGAVLDNAGGMVAEAAGDAIDAAGELVASGKEILGEAVDAGVQALGLEEEVEFVEEQLDAAGEAISDVGEAITDSIGGMVEGVSGWWDSWWGGDSGGRGVDGAGASMPSLRPGNAHTELSVNSGDAETRRAALLAQMDAAGITDQTERAAIMAQAHHESGGFNLTEENFNYSGRRLFELYGAGNSYGNRVRFNSVDEANALVARGQSAVGDVIYGGRMGNDQEGDGFKYRGRGAFQLTGKDNYARYSEMVFGDDRLVRNPELVNDPEVGAQVAIAYYQDRVSGRGIAAGDVDAVSRAINGGNVGLQDRRDLFASYMSQGVPAAEMVPSTGTSGSTLAGANAQLAESQAELAETSAGGATVIAPSTTVANNNSSTVTGMGSSSQLLTAEEAQMMGVS